MAHTVVGVFDSSSEAETAVQHLISSGFAEDYIDVTLQTADEDSEFGKKQGKESIGSFFRALFSNEEHTEDYFDYALSGSIVTVHTLSTKDAERAADILDEYGAVNLEERARQKSATDMEEQLAESKAALAQNELKTSENTPDTGNKRLRSRIIERRIEEKLRLRDERVHVAQSQVEIAPSTNVNNEQL